MKYTIEDLKEAVIQCTNIKQVLFFLGLRTSGGNYKTFRKLVKENNINISHFNSTILTLGIKNNLTIEELFVENSYYNHNGTLKNKIIKNNLLDYICSECKLTTEWNGKPIVLHLDHINGVNNDHRIENLRFLCPNCHSQTSTYCRGQNKNKQLNFCECGKQIDKYTMYCINCVPKPKKIEWPDSSTIIDYIMQYSFSGAANILGVSDNAIRKHLTNLEIDYKKIKLHSEICICGNCKKLKK